MSRDNDRVKWAAASAVCEEFLRCMEAGECDQLCRMATYTYAMYGKVYDSNSAGDTPELVNARIRFSREFRRNVYAEASQWDTAIADILRTRKRPTLSTWGCPRCGRLDCSGAVRLHAGAAILKSSEK